MSNPLRDRAEALRLDNDMSISAIAAAIKVPRSTVGDWLKGIGEARYVFTCRRCGERAHTMRATTKLCDRCSYREPPRNPPRPCVLCGRTFQPNRCTHRFCRGACRRKASRTFGGGWGE